MSADSLSSWLKLTLVPGIGGQSQRKLLQAFGSPEAVFSAGFGSLRSVIGEKAKLLLDFDDEAAIEAAIRWANGPDQHIITLADEAYPQSFLQIADPPSILYVRGRAELLNHPGLAVVGSRNPTPQGIQNAEAFSANLAASGLVIVSGMALGVDAAAHRGALSVNGDTVAFIGTGIDRVYPARNHELALEIGRRGAIVSEFPLGTPAMAANFPRRNRLISGLTMGALVVEAAVESGSLITARLAAEQGREVFAIPGSIHSPQAKGCHKLIKQGAKLVETAQDILEELNWSPRLVKMQEKQPEMPVSASEADFIEFMGFDPVALDELAVRASIPAEELSAKLLILELEGKIASLPGGRYQRIVSA